MRSRRKPRRKKVFKTLRKSRRYRGGYPAVRTFGSKSTPAPVSHVLSKAPAGG